MPIFEVEADGKRFEIEAPDQEAALSAFAQLLGEQQPTAMSVQPNLSHLPGVGPILGAIGYNGIPEARAPGYEPSAVPLLDPVNSLAHGFLEGIPIAGPALSDLATNLDAMTYGQSPTEREAINAGDQAQFGEASLMGEVGGAVAPLLALGATPLGGKLLGLTGGVVPRTLASLGSTAAISTADQMVRGESLQDAAVDAIAPSVAAALIPGGERALSAFVRSFGKTTAPSVEALKDEAGQLYDAARASGVEMSQAGTTRLSDEMFDIARQEGLVSPTGRVASSYPKIAEALRVFDDYAAGTMDVAQMQAVRRTLQDAAGSLDAGERRLGAVLLEKFDDVVEQGVPELAEAASIYHRAKKGELIETAIELAASRAGQFSGSGFENALRTEFRNLDRQIIKGQLKGISDHEAEAIRKVANGGPIENALRLVGKLAPTGVVSAGIGGGAGFAAGGPVGAAAVMGTGAVARALATAAQARNAQVASALMRRGGPHMPSQQQEAIVRALQVGAVPMSLLARSMALEGTQ